MGEANFTKRNGYIGRRQSEFFGHVIKRGKYNQRNMAWTVKSLSSYYRCYTASLYLFCKQHNSDIHVSPSPYNL